MPFRQQYIRDWTLESNAQLLNLRKQGVSWRIIARQLDKEVTTCLKHYRSVLVPGLNPGGPWLESGRATAADATLLRRRLVEGKSFLNIAKELDVDEKICRARFRGVLEPWLKDGLGHADMRWASLTDQTTIQIDPHLKQVEDTFRIIFQEQGLKASQVQEWYDQQLLSHFAKTKKQMHEDEIAETGWTKEMDEMLISLKETPSKTWRQIQDALGLDYVSCLIRYHQLSPPASARSVALSSALKFQGVPRPQLLDLHSEVKSRHGSRSGVWTAETDELLLKLKEVNASVTWQTIADNIGVTREYCYKRYRAVLEPLIKNMWTHENTEQLKELVAEKKSWTDISTALGIHHYACQHQWKIIQADMAHAAKKARVAQDQEEDVRDKMYHAAFRMRIERNYDNYDWNQLLGHFSHKGYAPEEAQRQRLQWLEQHRPWTPREETSLIQQVLRYGVSQWDRIAGNLNRMEPREGRRQGISAAECKIYWKNLDMPVRRTVDMHEWPSSARRVFWSVWLQQAQKHTGEDNNDIWVNISKHPDVPSDSEQCHLYFETATGSLKTLDDETLEDFARQQISKLQRHESGNRKKQSHWPKWRSVMLQHLIRMQLRSRLYPYSRQIRWAGIVRRLNRVVNAEMVDSKIFNQRQGLTDHNIGSIQELRIHQCKMHWVHLRTAPGPRWSQDELKLLERGIRELGYRWMGIQRKYLPWRTLSMLRTQWYLISDRAVRVTVDEYMTLLRAVEESQVGNDSDWEVDWKKVASRMPGWTSNPCRRVYEQSYQYMLKHTEFSPEEDAWLLQNINIDEPQDWKAIAKRFGQSGKDGWQYRLRWCQLTDHECT
ncbi:hypothetical protein BGZ50_009500 [Haplosporangium sp. Z 11]|nr:hypothetical protein BGZ50_009500 [Haplosporangium sp. Z 11]